MPARAVALPVSRFAKITPENPSLIKEQAQMQLVLTYLENSTDVGAQYILGPSRGSRHLSQARQTLYYLLHICFGMNYSRIAVLVQRDRTSVAHDIRHIEDLRDSIIFDRQLQFAEFAINALFSSGDSS